MESNMSERTCAVCGAALPSLAQASARYCSKRCSLAGQPRCSEPGCERPRRAKGLCNPHYKQLQGASAYARVEVPCDWCGALVSKHKTARYERRYCSLACRDEWRWWNCTPLVCAVPADHPVRSTQIACALPPDHPVVSTRVPLSHPSRVPAYWRWASWRVFYPDCEVCGRLFATPYTIKTCSESCRAAKRRADRNEARMRRRARKRDGFVAPVYRYKIHERDKWICHICGTKVHRSRKVPHPKAPVLDHVVPLAAGGTHEPANVATAHFLCNSLKSDGGGNEQLMLIG